ncbi:hypothetical protein LZG04_07985 [Saccharothrix sp. S26]|uniref:hypothetical protein n=1 Tax=Saccharothrix sp. S26 TaxID=2907215 RepID=UPI001F226C1E|nr:hypothetical protein [Saccharothrix sp. S26]MCE6994747.1 hypothetical protein [Saccharothrix sp. S26]
MNGLRRTALCAAAVSVTLLSGVTAATVTAAPAPSPACGDTRPYERLIVGYQATAAAASSDTAAAWAPARPWSTSAAPTARPPPRRSRSSGPTRTSPTSSRT